MKSVQKPWSRGLQDIIEAYLMCLSQLNREDKSWTGNTHIVTYITSLCTSQRNRKATRTVPCLNREEKSPICAEISFSGHGLKCFSSSCSAFSCPVSFTWHWCSQRRPEKSPTSHWPHCTLLWDAAVLLELFQHPDPANSERALTGWIESSPLSAGCSLPASLWIPGAHQAWCNLSCPEKEGQKKSHLRV